MPQDWFDPWLLTPSFKRAKRERDYTTEELNAELWTWEPRVWRPDLTRRELTELLIMYDHPAFRGRVSVGFERNLGQIVEAVRAKIRKRK